MTTLEELVTRQRIERELCDLGGQRVQIEKEEAENREAIKKLLPEAIEAGLERTLIAEFVGLSRQTIHSWMRELGL